MKNENHLGLKVDYSSSRLQCTARARTRTHLSLSRLGGVGGRGGLVNHYCIILCLSQRLCERIGEQKMSVSLFTI